LGNPSFFSVRTDNHDLNRRTPEFFGTSTRLDRESEFELKDDSYEISRAGLSDIPLIASFREC
jgi:hypothetical protein